MHSVSGRADKPPVHVSGCAETCGETIKKPAAIFAGRDSPCSAPLLVGRMESGPMAQRDPDDRKQGPPDRRKTAIAWRAGNHRSVLRHYIFNRDAE